MADLLWGLGIGILAGGALSYVYAGKVITDVKALLAEIKKKL